VGEESRVGWGCVNWGDEGSVYFGLVGCVGVRVTLRCGRGRVGRVCARLCVLIGGGKASGDCSGIR